MLSHTRDRKGDVQSLREWKRRTRAKERFPACSWFCFPFLSGRRDTATVRCTVVAFLAHECSVL